MFGVNCSPNTGNQHPYSSEQEAIDYLHHYRPPARAVLCSTAVDSRSDARSARRDQRAIMQGSMVAHGPDEQLQPSVRDDKAPSKGYY